ncbi:hypothetical protein BD770DRAFT_398779 [Pilaira anomala]|nr:hypothetical protein BD770DRAFT_398779 [Pilaira anomala]
MPNEIHVNGLIGITQDELNEIAKSVEDISEGENEEEEKEEVTLLPVYSNHVFNKELNDKEIKLYKTVRREIQTSCVIPESKSKENDGLSYTFSCKSTCDQFISYQVLSTTKYKSFDLEKLDVVLNSNSILPIQVECTLNGLHVLQYPTWISDTLHLVMSNVKFKNISSSSKEEGLFHYQVQKAFVTTPLSYLLQLQAPHGVLDKLYIHLDWTTTNSKSFQTAWNLESDREFMSRYVEEILVTLLGKRTFISYPLVFSDIFVKRSVPIISYLPRIAQSIQKMIKASKDTCPESEFNERLSKQVKTIEKNTQIMRPMYTTEDDTVTNLTLGMYYTATRKSNIPTSNSLFNKELSSPNSLNAVTKIWSIMVSAQADTDS